MNDSTLVYTKYKALDGFNDAYTEAFEGLNYKLFNDGFSNRLNDGATQYDKLFNQDQNFKNSNQHYKFYGKNRLFRLFLSARNDSEVEKVKNILNNEINTSAVFQNFSELTGIQQNSLNGIFGKIKSKVKPQDELLKEILENKKNTNAITGVAKKTQNEMFDHDIEKVNELILWGTQDYKQISSFFEQVTRYYKSFETLSVDLENNKFDSIAQHKTSIEAQISDLNTLKNDIKNPNDNTKIDILLARLAVQKRVVNEIVENKNIKLKNLKDLSLNSLRVAQGKKDVGYGGLRADGENVKYVFSSIGTGFSYGFEGLKTLGIDIVPAWAKDIAGKASDNKIGDDKAWKKNTEESYTAGVASDAVKTWVALEVTGAATRRLGALLEKQNNFRGVNIRQIGTGLIWLGEGMGLVSNKMLGRASVKNKKLRDEALKKCKEFAKNGDIDHVNAQKTIAENMDHAGTFKILKDLLPSRRNKEIASTNLNVEALEAKNALSSAEEALNNTHNNNEALKIAQQTAQHTLNVLAQRVAVDDAKIALDAAKGFAGRWWQFWKRNDVSQQKRVLDEARSELEKIEQEAKIALEEAGNTEAAKNILTKPVSAWNPRLYLPEKLGGFGKDVKDKYYNFQHNKLIEEAYKKQEKRIDEVLAELERKHGKDVDLGIITNALEKLFTNKIGVSLFKVNWPRKSIFNNENIMESFFPRTHNFYEYKNNILKYLEIKNNEVLSNAMKTKLQEMENYVKLGLFDFRNNYYNTHNVLMRINTMLPNLSLGNGLRIGMPLVFAISDYKNSKRDALANDTTYFDANIYALKRAIVTHLETATMVVPAASAMLSNYLGGFNLVEYIKELFGIAEHTGAAKDKITAEKYKTLKNTELVQLKNSLSEINEELQTAFKSIESRSQEIADAFIKENNITQEQLQVSENQTIIKTYVEQKINEIKNKIQQASMQKQEAIKAQIAEINNLAYEDNKTVALKADTEEASKRRQALIDKYKSAISGDEDLLNKMTNADALDKLKPIKETLKVIMAADNPSETDLDAITLELTNQFQQAKAEVSNEGQ